MIYSKLQRNSSNYTFWLAAQSKLPTAGVSLRDGAVAVFKPLQLSHDSCDMNALFIVCWWEADSADCNHSKKERSYLKLDIILFKLVWEYHLPVFTYVLHLGGARVLVELQSGPLHRVIGYPISISCNVSGFSNPSAQQDFRFSVYKPEKPTQEIQIISTDDKNYAMAVYGARVREGVITLERLSVTSVLFHVKSLVDGDEGEYECHTPNSEAVYDGTYNAKTTLKGNVFFLTYSSNFA